MTHFKKISSDLIRVNTLKKKRLPKKYLKNVIFPSSQNSFQVSFYHSQKGKDEQTNEQQMLKGM